MCLDRIASLQEVMAARRLYEKVIPGYCDKFGSDPLRTRTSAGCTSHLLVSPLLSSPGLFYSIL